MLFIILILLVGSVLVYISQFNFEQVSLNLGFYIFSDLPLFFVIVGSLVVGMLLAYLMHLSYVLSQTFLARKKSKMLNEKKDEILELTKRVHQLEIENEQLRMNSDQQLLDPKAL